MLSRTGRGLTVGAVTLLLAGSVLAQSYPDPAGGWLYTYEANAGEDAGGSGGFTALDGTFSHDDGSDEWDGSAIGAGSPGGANIVDGALRIQDTGDPRDHGFSDPGSNRKIYLGHDLGADGASATMLDDGVTLYVRARVPTPNGLDDLHPDGGGAITPYPAGGDGYPIHDSGKGNISLKQSNGGVISFSLDPEVSGLQMNGLDGNVITGNVDTGEGTANVLATDVTAFHEYWITISGGGSGTHQVTIYMDGSTTAAGTFDVTAGSGDDFGGLSYLAFGCGSTGASGALDIDYARVAAGVQAPGPAVEVPALSTVGLMVMALTLLVAGTFVLRGRRLPALATR